MMPFKQKVQVSDTTKDDQWTIVRNQI